MYAECSQTVKYLLIFKCPMHNGQRPRTFIPVAPQLFLSLTRWHSSHNSSPFVIRCLDTSFLACQQNDKLSPSMVNSPLPWVSLGQLSLALANKPISWAGMKSFGSEIRHQPLWEVTAALTERSITQNENKWWYLLKTTRQPNSFIGWRVEK